VSKDDDEFGSSSVGTGIAGINLADQASLEYHSMMMGLAFSLAQATLAEKDEQSSPGLLQ
jgi:hypothetical protein